MAAAVDLSGNYLAPGFIDLHIHGALGRDTMEASPEAFRTICDYHASGGTTSLLLTTVTASIAEIVDVLRAVRTSASGGIRQIAGVHVEGPFISRARAGAQRAEFIRDPDPDSDRSQSSEDSGAKARNSDAWSDGRRTRSGILSRTT